MTKRYIITWLTAIYIALLTTLCLIKISTPTPDLQVIGFDKVVHFCFYAGLNVLLASTIIARKGRVAKRHIFATTSCAIIYGIAIEFIQQHVGRDFDLYDIAANSFGAISAGLLLCSNKIRGLISRCLK